MPSGVWPPLHPMTPSKGTKEKKINNRISRMRHFLTIQVWFYQYGFKLKKKMNLVFFVKLFLYEILLYIDLWHYPRQSGITLGFPLSKMSYYSKANNFFLGLISHNYASSCVWEYCFLLSLTKIVNMQKHTHKGCICNTQWFYFYTCVRKLYL